MSKKILVVVAHPDLEKSRINRTWIEHLRRHPDRITVHDLYRVYPDGKIDVAAEQMLLEAHQRIIFQFPFFWFSTPPLLKQWLDEVFTYGWVYGPGGDKLEGKEIGLAISTGGKAEVYQAGAQNQFTISELVRPLQATVNFVRAKFLPIFVLQGAMYQPGDAEVEANASAYARHVLGEV
jgi:putative NADPH-quinone reductase